jgi:sugar fermentation stimulation protein A
VKGVLIRRYKRFMADVRLSDGAIVTAHCANPGSMLGLNRPGSAVLLSRSANPARKLPFTWELVRRGRTWVCVNTQVANRVVAHWIEMRRIDGLVGEVRREVSVAGSRFDFRVGDDCLVEVKTVTLRLGEEGAFPDSVTERGRRHLETLARLEGYRRILLYFVARSDVAAVRPAREIDPAYADALRHAVDRGVEVIAIRAGFGPKGGVRRGPRLDVIL